MKKLLILAALALAVFDAAALYTWMEHKKKAAAAAAAPRPIVDTPAATQEPAPVPEQIRALPGSVPCGSVESCRAYCQAPEHQQECRDMADKLRAETAAAPAPQDGAVPQEQRQPAPPDPFFKAVAEAGPQVTACLKKLLGAKRFQSIRAGNAPDFDEATGRAVERCFRRKHVESRNPKRGGGRRGGPGGCRSEQACIAYCSNASHREECLSSSAIPEQFKNMIRQFPAQ